MRLRRAFMGSPPTLLSLFDYSGVWARPYEDAGWNVILWDQKHTSDLYATFKDVNDACTDYFYDNIFENYGTVDGILAAVPCDDFAVSGARWWPDKDADGRTYASMELVRQTLRIVNLCSPLRFWALENPVGRLNTLFPELPKPWYFDPYWFGDPYTKKTGIWGQFRAPVIRSSQVVRPIMYETSNGKRGSWMWAKLGGNSERTKELRSVTPAGFARAFFEANH